MTKDADRHMRVMPSPDALEASARAARSGSLPPVEKWDPPYCGEMDMVIAADGTWWHEGTPIGRAPLVRLFSTILKREEERFFLVTPAEKLGIRVEDAPFVAVDVETEGADLVFTTNVGDRVTAGPAHPIRVARDRAEPRPYVEVRAGLEALIDRKTFYRLAEMGVVRDHEGADWFGLVSGGTFFPAIPASDLA